MVLRRRASRARAPLIIIIIIIIIIKSYLINNFTYNEGKELLNSDWAILMTN